MVKVLVRFFIGLCIVLLTFISYELILRYRFGLGHNFSVDYYSFYPEHYFEDYGLLKAKEASSRCFLNDTLFKLYDVNPNPHNYGTITDDVKTMRESYSGTLQDNPMKMWNIYYLRDLCNQPNVFESSLGKYKNGYVYAYKPYDTCIYPTYRYLPNAYMGKGSPRFNKFGWGGSDISIRKKPRQIRIAFLGASTTQQFGVCDFAYPDYIEAWFDAWAAQNHLDIDFEVINSARVAHRSMDIRYIFKYELEPINPDVAVYYEGRNQMFRWNMEGVERERDSASFIYKAYDIIVGHSVLIQWTLDRLKISHRSFLEQSKRPCTNVDLNRKWNSPQLPIALNQIFSDVSAINKEAKAIRCEFVFTSYAMIIDSEFLFKPNWGSVYGYYMKDFGDIKINNIAAHSILQRQLYKEFAEENGIKFIDVATDLLKYPELFGDPIHLSCSGMKYQAWIVFKGLLPIIQQKIASGQLPQPEFKIYSSHPYICDSIIHFPVPTPRTKAGSN